MSTPLRGECRYCGRRFRLTTAGYLYRHESVEDTGRERVIDECAGSGSAPSEGSIRMPGAERGPMAVRGTVATPGPEWSWWERHGYYVWMAGVWVSGFIVGGAVVQILRNLAEGRGWLG